MRVPLSKVFSLITIEMRNDFYGDSNPSKHKKLIYNILFPAMLLAFYGYYNDFVISSTWSIICLSVSGVTALLFSFFWYSEEAPAISSDPQKTLRKILWFTIAPSALFFVFYVAAAHGISSILTSFIGTPMTIKAPVYKYKYSGTKACKYQISGVLLFNAMPSYLCISKSEFELLPADAFEAIITGKQSYLGFNVESLRQNQRTNAAYP